MSIDISNANCGPSKTFFVDGPFLFEGRAHSATPDCRVRFDVRGAPCRRPVLSGPVKSRTPVATPLYTGVSLVIEGGRSSSLSLLFRQPVGRAVRRFRATVGGSVLSPIGRTSVTSRFT